MFEQQSLLQLNNLINNEWLINKKISKGTFGELFICRNIFNSKQFAMKIQTEIGSLKVIFFTFLEFFFTFLISFYFIVGRRSIKIIKW